MKDMVRKTMRSYFLLFMVPVLLSSACAPAGLNMGQYRDDGATPSDFIYCYGYGCSSQIRLGLHDAEWQRITHLLKNPKDAKAERAKIAKAIALMEQWTGELAETSADQAYAPLIRKSHQELDCIDETVNTHKYLSFFEQADLLKFHTLSRPVYKGLFLDGTYPHNSAAVTQTETGQIYVIDSYVHANGKKPVIRTIEDWRTHPTFESAEL